MEILPSVLILGDSGIGQTLGSACEIHGLWVSTEKTLSHFRILG